MTNADPEFDQYAEQYEALLRQSLAISGESKEYFARERLRFLAEQLRPLGCRPTCVMDYGCGTGTATPYLLDDLGAERVIGVDPSAKSLEVARRQFGRDGVRFETLDNYQPAGSVDVAYASGVFHHIPPADRPAAAAYVFRCVRPGGVFALWEHSPFNPGTRYSMSRCPFDDGVVMLWPRATRRMLAAAGFEVLGTRYLFLFPHFLRALRPIERFAARLPLGAQYEILCRRPSAL